MRIAPVLNPRLPPHRRRFWACRPIQVTHRGTSDGRAGRDGTAKQAIWNAEILGPPLAQSARGTFFIIPRAQRGRNR